MRRDGQWSVIDSCVDESRDRLVSELSLDPISATCLINRGYVDPVDVRAFLEPKLAHLQKPTGMRDLKKGAERLCRGIVEGEKIGVFGDYDVDGITSASLMYLFLREMGCHVEVHVANRFSGGYGLDEAVVDTFSDQRCTLLMVHDCGTSDHAAIDRAGQKGIDVVVVDHHRVEGDCPPAHAFINPQRGDCDFSDQSLAAVGLTFYFCVTVRSLLIEKGYLRVGELEMRRFLDLVALGTVADVVPLVGNNRILVHHGLKVMSKTRRPGIDALLDSTRIHATTLNAAHISFQLAPRINAAGRLADAMNAFELLVSTVKSDAREYASLLESLVQQRREIEQGVTREAVAQATAILERDPEKRVLLLGGDGWHKGVLGIVAARLSEQYSRPVYVVGFDDNTGTGSVRGGGQISLYDSLEYCSSLLERYGGHKDAAGFSVVKEKFSRLDEQLEGFATTNWTATSVGEITCDLSLKPSQLTYELYRNIERLGPFGMGNPEPVFEIVGLDVLSARVVGQQHLKLSLKTPAGTISAFGPGMGDQVGHLPQIVKVAATIVLDEWRKENSIELKLVMPPKECDRDDLF